LIGNISGKDRKIEKRKTALSTTITPTFAEKYLATPPKFGRAKNMKKLGAISDNFRLIANIS